MTQFNVTGMSCAACQARVEKAVSNLDGVAQCNVNLLTNSMAVEGTASDEEIICAVMEAGYGASLKEDMKITNQDEETKKIKNRLISSLAFLLILMYFSMGHAMWGWPLPNAIETNYVLIGSIQIVLTIIIMIINRKFFVNGFGSLAHKNPNMDTLVAMGSAAAFVYSSYVYIKMCKSYLDKDIHRAMMYMHDFYFESAAMILTLITVGKMLESRSKGKTTDALKSLMSLAPKTATILTDGIEKIVPVDNVKVNDIFVVKPGENIPVDGIIIEGNCAVNESSLTGESIPCDKKEGDIVSVATLNQSGFIKCRALRVGEDTTLSQIIKMVSDAAATKAPIAKVADKVSGIFVPVVIVIAIIATVVWLLAGESIGFALARGISVLVISCPCALGLATPVAIMVGSGKGAKNGILFKTAQSLEETGKTTIVALDKTGTITKGEPVVTDIFPVKEISSEQLLSLAYTLESKSEHPLANAIVKKAKEMGMKPEVTKEFKIEAGNGLSAICGNDELCAGNLKFISGKIELDNNVLSTVNNLATQGKTPLLFCKNNKFAGIIAVADTIKEDSILAIKELKSIGIKVVMLTGDNEITANSIGKQVGVDEVIAGVLPQGKEEHIRQLQTQGKVIMVGDGINDAPALTRADIGMAIGAGTDVAIDAADVVLVKSSLMDAVAAIRLSKLTLRNIHQNLFWAFFYNAIGIPLAAGVWIPVFGLKLNPMFGAAAMSLSSFCVVTNALRLNVVKLYNKKEFENKTDISNYSIQQNMENEVLLKDSQQTDNSVQQKHVSDSIEQTIKDEKEIIVMEKTLKIEGMMCGHCEARVKKVLEALDVVNEAIVSHEQGTAIVKLNSDIDNEQLKKVVEDQDYKVLSVE